MRALLSVQSIFILYGAFVIPFNIAFHAGRIGSQHQITTEFVCRSVSRTNCAHYLYQIGTIALEYVGDILFFFDMHLRMSKLGFFKTGMLYVGGVYVFMIYFRRICVAKRSNSVSIL